jgi:hypothetical protein
MLIIGPSLGKILTSGPTTITNNLGHLIHFPDKKEIAF